MLCACCVQHAEVLHRLNYDREIYIYIIYVITHEENSIDTQYRIMQTEHQ